MNTFEVPTPILNGPYDEPAEHWLLREGEPPQRKPGRREAGYWYRDPRQPAGDDAGAKGAWEPLPLVNLIRERVAAWRADALRGAGGVTRTTCELMNHWRREGREHRLFFAQLEAAETIIFVVEARADLRQGIEVPMDDLGERQEVDGFAVFRRYACKMATGSGKTTVMAMLAAWSILNKVNDRGDGRFSDTVLAVCPNVTIRSRLAELDPAHGDASLYRRRDLVPQHLMADLNRGRVLVVNWHVFAPQSVQVGGTSARVSKAGRRVAREESIVVGEKPTSGRGRSMTPETLAAALARGDIEVIAEERDNDGALVKVTIRSYEYVESDTALVNRVLGREVGGKRNVLVFNDEAHHAYRIRREADEADDNDDDAFGDDDELEAFVQEATVWIDGLDRINKLRGINFCVDLSATPYFLARVGRDTNRTFPWVVSDFGLTDAIESGLVKIPQLAVRDTTGAEVPGYFNIWRWIMPRLTPAERGGRRGSPKPEAILKWAHTPIAMLGGLWEEEVATWAKDELRQGRSPVFILVCKNTRIAKVVYEWLAENKPPSGIPPAGIKGFLNHASDGRGAVNTIRVDTKVVHETDGDTAKSDESAWMRLTLDTVGKVDWPRDRQGRAVYPDGFEALAGKLGRPLSPPGRDVRCIVSVGMLTEGWDCSTVTHIIGLRPFTSQLLCEQVVGRGLRRASYELGDDGKLTEEVAKVLGVPFEVIPFKENKGDPAAAREKRHHVRAIPEKARFEIRFPRVEGYSQAIRNRVTVDCDTVASWRLDPMDIPPEIQMKAALAINDGRPSLTGPGRLEDVTLNPYRAGRRRQELSFTLARDLVRGYAAQPRCQAPAHVLFPQVARIVERYLAEKVQPAHPAEVVDVFLAPYYGWVHERLLEAIHADAAGGEAPELPLYERSRGPGSTSEVSFWTAKDVREVVHSHLNYAVADTRKWEQSAAFRIDRHRRVQAFVKNEQLGFTIPYLHNGQPHEYIPDFIVRLGAEGDDPVDPLNLILETKGYDKLAEVKRQAAERWIAAVNAEGSFGRWAYRMARAVEEVEGLLG